MVLKEVIEPGEDKGFVAHVPALRGGWSQGETRRSAGEYPRSDQGLVGSGAGQGRRARFSGGVGRSVISRRSIGHSGLHYSRSATGASRSRLPKVAAHLGRDQ